MNKVAKNQPKTWRPRLQPPYQDASPGRKSHRSRALVLIRGSEMSAASLATSVSPHWSAADVGEVVAGDGGGEIVAGVGVAEAAAVVVGVDAVMAVIIGVELGV